MKILSSNLSMDASYGHMDVNKLHGLAQEENRNSSTEDIFRLNPGTIGAGIERLTINRYRSETTAHSLVTQGGEERQFRYTEQEILGVVVSEIAGSKVHIRDISQLPAAGMRGANALFGERRILSTEQGLQIAVGVQSVHYESEMARVQSSGSICTDDGREITFRLELFAEREEFTQQSLITRSASMLFMDPLVLNFEGGLDSLVESSFCFDLDCDGAEERMNSLRSGKGYLVLDHNKDGAVNNGSELFGPTTGSAFAELAVYDEDGNNWIDENDQVFDELYVWLEAGGQGEQLVSLRDAGVGAISLAAVDSHFNLKDKAGRVIGQVSNSGIFLTEEGEVRSLAELDLRIDQAEGGTAQTAVEEKSITPVQEAIIVLRKMIRARRRQLTRLATMQRELEHSAQEKDWLQRKFWEWQER